LLLYAADGRQLVQKREEILAKCDYRPSREIQGAMGTWKGLRALSILDFGFWIFDCRPWNQQQAISNQENI
jgi:hypothetical protein